MESPSKSQHNSSQTSKEQCSTTYGKKNSLGKTILYNKGTFRGITTSDFKLYYRAIVIKTVCLLAYQMTHLDQRNEIGEPDINPHTYEHLIFDKEAKLYNGKKESIFNKCCWNNWMTICID